MIINGIGLLVRQPIVNMIDHKVREHGVTYGLGEAGYDIRIKQEIQFVRDFAKPILVTLGKPDFISTLGRFTLASAIEEFDMPSNLVAVVHDKSTWARRGLSVFNTVIEPGWKGFLTLELVYHGHEDLTIPAGAGIAQVLFHETQEHRAYEGRYQNQKDEPVEARDA